MPQEKIDKFRQLVESQPDNELAHYSLGTALFEEAVYEEAEQHFSAALEKKGDWVLAYILRARCLIHMKRLDEARALLLIGRDHSEKQKHDSPIEEIDDLLETLP